MAPYRAWIEIEDPLGTYRKNNTTVAISRAFNARIFPVRHRDEYFSTCNIGHASLYKAGILLMLYLIHLLKWATLTWHVAWN